MNEFFTIEATPVIARKIVHAQHLCKMDVSEEIIELAQHGLLSEHDIKPFGSQYLECIQRLVDCDSASVYLNKNGMAFAVEIARLACKIKNVNPLLIDQYNNIHSDDIEHNELMLTEEFIVDNLSFLKKQECIIFCQHLYGYHERLIRQINPNTIVIQNNTIDSRASSLDLDNIVQQRYVLDYGFNTTAGCGNNIKSLYNFISIP